MDRTRYWTSCLPAACFAALGTLAPHASAAPVFRTVGEVGSISYYGGSGSTNGVGWWAQVGSAGHVVYFDGDRIYHWDDGVNTLLHTIGDSIEGLQPGVTTTLMLGNHQHEYGRLLGVDREGGVSVMLQTTTPPGYLDSPRIVASTTFGGGLRVLAAHPAVSEGPAAIPSSTSTHTQMGFRRSESGHTLVRQLMDSQTALWIGAPTFGGRQFFFNGQQIPGTDLIGELRSLYSFSSLGRNFENAVCFDISPDGSSVVHYFSYQIPSSTTDQTGVLLTRNGVSEVLALSTEFVAGFRLWRDERPSLRVNDEGQVLFGGSIVLSHPFRSDSIVLFDTNTQTTTEIARENAPIAMTNHPDVSFTMPPGTQIGRDMYLGNDGTVLLTVNVWSSTGAGKHVIRRSPSGEMTMMFTPNAEFLGLPAADFVSAGPTRISPDATSAAVGLRIANVYSLVHATPRGVTHFLTEGDSIEVSPGEFKTVKYIELHTVNGEHVLFGVWFHDDSKYLMLATIPDCPADLNADGVVDADDFFLFLQFFAAGDPRADINNDGVIDADDFFEYLTLFAQGC